MVKQQRRMTMAKKVVKKISAEGKHLNSHCAFDKQRVCNATCHWYVIKPGRPFGGSITGKCIIYDIKDIIESISNRTR
jgi:hypothetical protein